MIRVTLLALVVAAAVAAGSAAAPQVDACTNVPDKGPAFDFTQACLGHDDCYDTAGRSRRECDQEFLTRMLGWCAKAHKNSPVRLASCRATARAYHRGVSTAGRVFYDKAQFAAKFVGAYEGTLTIASYTTDANITGLEDTSGTISFTVAKNGAVRGDVAGALNTSGSGPISITTPIGWGGRATGSIVLRWSGGGVSATATVSGTLTGVILDGSNTPFSMNARLQLDANKVG